MTAASQARLPRRIVENASVVNAIIRRYSAPDTAAEHGGEITLQARSRRLSALPREPGRHHHRRPVRRRGAGRARAEHRDVAGHGRARRQRQPASDRSCRADQHRCLDPVAAGVAAGAHGACDCARAPRTAIARSPSNSPPRAQRLSPASSRSRWPTKRRPSPDFRARKRWCSSAASGVSMAI